MTSFRRFAVAAALYGAGTSMAAAGPLPINLIVLMPGETAQRQAFEERLRQVPYLSNSGEGVSGSNVALIVSVAQVPTSGGTVASTTTGLLAASTLGIIPVAENKDISVHYELRVNYQTVAVFDYSKNFTQVSNLWGNMGKIPEDARQWLMGTVDTLTRDIAANPSMAALQAEYDSYFGKK